MDIMSSSIVTHVYMIYFLFAIMVFNLIAVNVIKDFVKLSRLLRGMTPLYHLVNAMVIYTGMIVSAYVRDLSPTVILMIFAGIFILVIEIKRYKKMRIIKIADIELQTQFYSYAKKIYMIEIAVLVFVYIISKIF
ncbi:hypothetical protein A9Q76_00110 [Arcobacter sp. 31_11_sub10_T18]|nr:hypothetical protein A9Q76_00110 [Arcobacter sp. 31_11_sub10_T18]